ncbi:DUF494 domain-containing protein [Accumulibacter sp.]|uniref:DUF494 family protein n=1 Tax=Accumulibacter sp. TaxID=2053492 RepID=UPI0026140753|nr:DUF494 domain-containing protein [Accumulibacter sp.]
MIDILVYLFANYHDFKARPKTRAPRRRLSAVGFSAAAIGEALQWLDGLSDRPVVELADSHGRMRIYTRPEQNKLVGIDCLGFVAVLEANRLLSPAMRETAIDRAMILNDDPVPLAKFKIIVLMVLWSREQDMEPLIVEELLDDGGTHLLH